MPDSCKYCGAEMEKASKRCRICGAVVPSIESDSAPVGDQRTERVRALVALARQCQQKGNVDAALDHAREALALHPHCNTIHALLGHLYEQGGNQQDARRHFEAALQLEPSADDVCETLGGVTGGEQDHRSRSSWMALILVGCVMLSALAVLFSYWPDGNGVEQGAIFKTEMQQEKSSGQTFTDKVPVPKSKPVVSSPAKTSGSGTNPVKTVSDSATTAISASDAKPALEMNPRILGPSLHSRMIADNTRPTVEAADQAYFYGQYERAVTIYEAVLDEDERPHPRLHQNLAFCYQQLGNSRKAEEYLHKAVQGYQTLVEKEPHSSAAQQGLRTCETALRTLDADSNNPTP